MTDLLIEVMRKVAELPTHRQEDAAHLLLEMLDNDAPRRPFSDDDMREIDLAIAEADAGQFASDAEVEAVLNRPWA